MDDHDILERLEQRRQMLRAWLDEYASTCASEQLHLIADSQERAYWHFGYYMALSDVLQALRDDQ